MGVSAEDIDSVQSFQTLDAHVVEGEHIHAVHAEDEDHLGGPAADALEGGEGFDGLGEVVAVEFSYDVEGLAAAEAEALTWPGVYYVRTWLNEGRCEVGDSLMYVLIGADIRRPNCIDALQKLVGHIKNNLVVKKEVFA